tara:strand:+ start:624 stop:2507 length:1884 start_codon:yes stop_codon:yes gene_type:complete
MLFHFFAIAKGTTVQTDSITIDKAKTLIPLYTGLKKHAYDTIYLNAFLKKSTAGDYALGESVALNFLGIYFRDKSNYSRSIKYHTQSFNLAKKMGNLDMEIIAQNMLGVVYRRMDNVKLAVDFHQAALALADAKPVKDSITKKSTAVSLNSIGNIYLSLSENALAEDYFKRAIAYEEELESDLGLAINYANLGITYDERGRYAEAIDNYKKSLFYNRKINSSLGEVICQNSIGQVYLKQGNPQEALALIEPTIPIAEKINDGFYMAMSYINLGWAYTDLDRLIAAETNLIKGRDLAKSNNNKQFLRMAYDNLSTLYEKKGDYQLSLVNQRLAQETQAEFLNEINHKYVTYLNLKYDSESNQAKIKLLETENELVTVQLDQSRQNMIFVIVFAGLMLLLVYILYRQYRLKKEKEVLKAEQKLMRSQMNPHFIFNALLSIKIYMEHHAVDEAIEYLNQFAKLIRSILTSSLEKEITLEEEILTMKRYVSIENMRLNNEVDFEIDIDSDLKLDEVKIPSLILQPFVENALWHGLQPKEGHKWLKLDVHKKNDNFVEITIEDNGIGRKKTMEVPSDKRNTQKKSIGINLTMERLQNFSRNFSHGHTLNIIDLYDDAQNPRGTRVLLNLPVS